jgi:hypothetical protein
VWQRDRCRMSVARPRDFPAGVRGFAPPTAGSAGRATPVPFRSNDPPVSSQSISSAMGVTAAPHQTMQAIAGRDIAKLSLLRPCIRRLSRLHSARLAEAVRPSYRRPRQT